MSLLLTLAVAILWNWELNLQSNSWIIASNVGIFRNRSSRGNLETWEVGKGSWESWKDQKRRREEESWIHWEKEWSFYGGYWGIKWREYFQYCGSWRWRWKVWTSSGINDETKWHQCWGTNVQTFNIAIRVAWNAFASRKQITKHDEGRN